MKGLKLVGTVIGALIVISLVTIMIVTNVNLPKKQDKFAEYENANIEALPDNLVDESLDEDAGLNPGEQAPDFELTTLDGEQVKLSDYKGQKVLLNFWASWCPPCKTEMPYMETYSNDYAKEDNVAILAVNMTTLERGQKEKVPKFVEEHGLTFPILMDEAGIVKDLYDVMIYPTTYVINEEGMITKRTNLLLEIPYIQKLIEEADTFEQGQQDDDQEAESDMRNPALDKGLGVGNQAPDFELQTTDGETVKLSDSNGKMTFVNFWTSWCPSCGDELTVLQEFYAKHQKSDDIEVLGVNLTNLERDADEALSTFIEERKITFPVLTDTDGKVEALYKIEEYPTTYIINEEGYIVDIVNIPIDVNLLEWLLENSKDFDVEQVR